MLSVPAAIAATRLGGIVAGAANDQTTGKLPDQDRGVQRSATVDQRTAGRLSSTGSAACPNTAAGPSVPPVHPPLSLPRLQSSLWRFAALHRPLPESTPSSAGLSVI